MLNPFGSAEEKCDTKARASPVLRSAFVWHSKTAIRPSPRLNVSRLAQLIRSLILQVGARLAMFEQVTCSPAGLGGPRASLFAAAFALDDNPITRK